MCHFERFFTSLLSYFGEPGGLCDPGRTYCDDYLTFTVEKHKKHVTEMARQFEAQLSLFIYIYFHIVGIVAAAAAAAAAVCRPHPIFVV